MRRHELSQNSKLSSAVWAVLTVVLTLLFAACCLIKFLVISPNENNSSKRAQFVLQHCRAVWILSLQQWKRHHSFLEPLCRTTLKVTHKDDHTMDNIQLQLDNRICIQEGEAKREKENQPKLSCSSKLSQLTHKTKKKKHNSLTLILLSPFFLFYSVCHLFAVRCAFYSLFKLTLPFLLHHLCSNFICGSSLTVACPRILYYTFVWWPL